MDRGTNSYLRFLSGDDSGLVEIVTEYKDGLIFYLNSFVGDMHIAEELAEDTFVRLFTKRPQDKRKGTFKTWLYTIGRNVAINYLRHSSAKETLLIEEYDNLYNGEEDPQLVFLKEERKITVHRALEKLKSEYRQILWLIYFEEFTCKQAAKIMKKSVHNTEMLASRARQALKAQLNKEGITYEDY